MRGSHGAWASQTGRLRHHRRRHQRKGSTVAFIKTIARASGLRVGATSPHLLAYNERVRIDGRDAGDDALVEAFEAVERRV